MRSSTLQAKPYADYRRSVSCKARGMHDSVPDDPYGILASLFFHESRLRRVESLFRLVGFVHLFRSSGLHLFALFFWADRGIRFFLKGRGASPEAARVCSGVLHASLALATWVMQGFHFSWARPMMTHLLRSYFRTRGVRVRILFPLLFTAGLECILSREKGISPGAFHYYLAVAGSLVAMESHPSDPAWRLHARMAVYSWIPGAMWELGHDRLVSFMTPLYSWISIPPISSVLYPLAAGAKVVTGEFPAWVVGAWALWIELLVRLADHLPAFASVVEGSWVPAAVLVMLVDLVPVRNRLWILPALLMFCRLLWQPIPGKRVIQWDVGQGDAALLQTSGRNELIDVGPAWGADPSVWIRRLTRAGVNRIDSVLLTHLDADHRGGLDWLAPVVKIDCIEVHDPGRAVQKLPVALHPKLRGKGCIRNAELSWFRSPRAGGNQWMAGLVFPLSSKQVFFALGDGDGKQERLYADWIGERYSNAKIRVWKAGHHGSKHSSDPILLARLKPTLIWISVGARNGYGHPSPEALERLVRSGGMVHRTDVEGDLTSSSRE